ncbi:MAG: helix-turn-helix transcriptional regulator [Rhizobiales bacterium]|nr:helix-turn-helix transcriptional regulator [Hyphomicrobiales bacterium]
MVSKIEHKNRTGCPIACSLDILGDHWTLLVIRNLMFLGLHEYKDMLQTEEQISSSILTDRLKKLECEKLIASIPHPDSKRRKLYYLTASGKDLIHVMVNLVLWANTHLSDRLNIPAEKKDLLEKNPEQFKSLILEQIQKWEQEHL